MLGKSKPLAGFVRLIFGAALLLLPTPPGFGQDMELTVLASKLREQIVKANKKTVAVVDLSNSQGYGPDFSQYMVDELSIRMVQDNAGFRVVTRNRLNQLMTEKGMKFSQDFDPGTFQKIGSFTGADAVVAGSFQVLTASIRVVFQVLDTKDGTIVTGVSGTLPKTKDLEAYLQSKNAGATVDDPVVQETGPATRKPAAGTGKVVTLNGGLQAQMLSLGRDSSGGRPVVTAAVQITNAGKNYVRLMFYDAPSAIDDTGVKFDGDVSGGVSGAAWCRIRPAERCIGIPEAVSAFPLQGYTEIDREGLSLFISECRRRPLQARARAFQSRRS